MASATTVRSGEATPLLAGAPGRREPQSGTRPSRMTAKERTLAMLDGAVKRAVSPAAVSRMSDIIRELEDGASRNRKQLWFGIITIINHFIGGILTFHILEGWNFIDCAYFVVVVTTTVGYGDLAPAHPLTKLYLCYFVSMAVLMISTCLAFFVSTLIEKQEELIMMAIVGSHERGDHESGPTFEISETASSRFGIFPSWLSDYNQVFATSTFLLALLAVGVWVFWYFEQMTLLNALYLTIISASTVGFGDLGPSRPITKVIMAIWLLLSTMTLAKLVGDQTEAFSRSKQRDATRRLLSARMDVEALRAMDKDADGKVSSGEFLASCLVELGKVSQADIDQIMDRFKQLDKDRSGNISDAEVSHE